MTTLTNNIKNGVYKGKIKQYKYRRYFDIGYANAVTLPEEYENGDAIEAFVNGTIRLNAILVKKSEGLLAFNFDDINETCYLNKDEYINLYPGYIQFVDVILYKIELF